METLLTIKTRRSIRSFEKREVSRKKINKVIEAGFFAPSSKNSNPWYFVVVKGKRKDRIADWMIKLKTKKNCGPMDLKNKKVRLDSTFASAKIIREASILILVFNRAPFTKNLKTVIKNIGSMSLGTYTTEIIGIGAAIENMLLAVNELGLGAVFLCDIYPAKQKIRKEFKIKHELVGSIAVGYPAYNLPLRKIRKDLVKFI